MAYATYTTEALVCGSKDSYTSDRSYLLFTKEAGMLWATARSVREEKSKQRQALQDFSFIRVSLVKGKTGWRIGSVEAQGNPFLSAGTRAERGFVKHIVTHLRRYVHGEVTLPNVYTDVATLLSTRRDEDVDLYQSIFQLRFFATLGYIAPHPSFKKLVEPENILEAVALYDPLDTARIEKAVTEASHVSHL